MKIKKRGDLTSQQLITIIILIVSFAIILIFFFVLSLKYFIGKQVCAQSLFMESIPVFGYLTSIKCETEHVCINNGGDCPAAGKDALDIKVSDVSEIKTKITNLIEDCWGMIGNGKINYGGDGDCGICHLIYFDQRIQNEEKEISLELTGKDYTQEIKGTFLTDKPIAIIAFNKDWNGKHSFIILSYYTADNLKKLGCEKYLF